MTDTQIISLLKSHAGIFEACRVSTFQCCRHAKDGQKQKITVEIYDAGERLCQPHYPRYHCVAISEDGKKRVTGHSNHSLETMLASLNWCELD